jgi:hypothetical protein
MRSFMVALALAVPVFYIPAALAQSGFRTPESLVRNVYAHYGRGSPEFSQGLGHDPATAARFLDAPLRQRWIAATDAPYDFLVQSKTWKLRDISIAITRKAYDRTIVTVRFINDEKPVMLNFITVRDNDGWLISEIETPHDSLQLFLTQIESTRRR